MNKTFNSHLPFTNIEFNKLQKIHKKTIRKSNLNVDQYENNQHPALIQMTPFEDEHQKHDDLTNLENIQGISSYLEQGDEMPNFKTQMTPVNREEIRLVETANIPKHLGRLIIK